MSKHAYTKGVVLIRCDGCKNIHLIADHLGWYDSMNPPGTIEEILAKKGETVKRLTLDGGKIVDGEGQQAGEVDEGLLEFLPTMMQKGKTTPPGVAVEEETAIQKETVVVVDAQSKS
ncbi:hypothetical protein HK104_008757 [Borealophlyctis nickersoniae]|nr:hypothetical protein HK104_008757 [Borealophlyctis nickersoniae]